MFYLALAETVDFTDGFIQFLIVAGLAFGGMCLASSYIRFQMLTGLLAPAKKSEGPSEAAPEDDGRAGSRFQIELLHRMGISGRSSPFTALLIGIPGEDSGAAVERLDQNARNLVRAGDSYFCLEDGRLALLAPDCEHTAALTLATRLQEGLQAVLAPGGKSGGAAVCVVAASYPVAGTSLAELLTGLQNAYEEAKLAPSHLAQAAPIATVSEEPEEEGGAPETDDAEKEEEPSDSLRVSVDVDPLTGVMRADRIGVEMQKYMALRRRADRPVSMLFFELDNMERYVSQYGQESHDALVKAAGELLQNGTRQADLPGRHGDCGFVVMMECPVDRALGVARRICVALRGCRIAHGDASLRATISAGVAGFPEHGRTPRDLFVHADAALQEAQRRGGNNALVFEGNMRREQRAASLDVDRF